MKSVFNLKQFAFLLSGILIFACKEKVTKENPEAVKDEVLPMADNADPLSELDPALNPLDVGKEFSKVYSDTLNVQMYELIMKPGDSIGLHQHLDHSAYVLEGGKLMVYINGTEAVEMDLPTGYGFVSGPLTDSAKNVGDTTIRILIHEIHRPRVQ